MKELPPIEAAVLAVLLPRVRAVLQELLEEQLCPIKEALQTAYRQDSLEYLTTQQALDLVRLSKPTFNKQRREGYIRAYYSSEKRVIYKRSELISYLESHKPQEGRVAC